jgi:outer membrane protein assembly factor BamB
VIVGGVALRNRHDNYSEIVEDPASSISPSQRGSEWPLPTVANGSPVSVIEFDQDLFIADETRLRRTRGESGVKTWVYKSPGRIPAAPLITKDVTIVVESSRGNTEWSAIRGLDTSTGKQIWTIEGDYGYGEPAILIDDGIHFLAIEQSGVARVAAVESGQIRWSNRIGAACRRFALSRDRSSVFAPVFSELSVVDLRQGSVRWRQNFSGSPIVREFKSPKLLILEIESTVNSDAVIGLYDLEIRAFVWSMEPGTIYYGPFVRDDLCVIRTNDDYTCLSADNGRPLWHLHIDADTMYTAELLIEDYVIAYGTKGVAAINVRTGALAWKTMLRDTDEEIIGCVANPEELVVLYEDGTIHTLNLADGTVVTSLTIRNAESLATAGPLVFVSSRVEEGRGQLIALRRGVRL